MEHVKAQASCPLTIFQGGWISADIVSILLSEMPRAWLCSTSGRKFRLRKGESQQRLNGWW